MRNLLTKLVFVVLSSSTATLMLTLAAEAGRSGS